MKWTPNDQQREILEALKRESDRDGNATQFCKDFASFTYSKFSKIMNVLEGKPSYFDEIKDREGLMEDLALWLKKLPRMRLEFEQMKDSPLFQLSTFRAVAKSVRQCKNKTTPERITKYIAPTGGSKTTLRRFLQMEFRGELPIHHVEARDCWRPTSRDNRNRANRTALLDICSALGMRLGEDVVSGGIPAIEEELVEFCSDVTRLLFFDEAEFFSRYVLNLFKMLLNQTKLIGIIACTPRAHQKWNCYYPDEADQIARRTHAVIQVSTISTEDAALFFPPAQFDADDRDKSLALLVTAATKFGHYSLLARIAKKLERTTSADFKEVEGAVKAAQLQVGRASKQDWDGNRPDEVLRLKAAA